MYRLVIALAAALVGCVEPTPLPPDEIEQDSVQIFAVPAWAVRRVDVLFVVEPDAAAQVAGELREMGKIMERWDDVHVGVIGADGNGALLHDDATPRFLISRVGFDGQTKNFDGALGDELAARVELAAPGERPLETALSALGDPLNAGFRRADASLALVIISAHDDASSAPISELVLALRAQTWTGRSGSLVIAGGELARLRSFEEQLGYSNYVLITEPGFATYVGHHGPSYPIPGPACFARPLLDLDPSTPGTQPDCSVTESVSDGIYSLIGEETAVPACDGTLSVMPCWRLMVDERLCERSYSPTQEYVAVIRRERPDRHMVALGQCASARQP